MLSVPIINSNKNTELGGNRLRQLQERLANVIYLIIDKKSMVGCRMITLIDIKLRQVFPEKNEAFGERSVILFRQLPSVLDLPKYTTNISHDTRSNDGIAAYKEFREVYKPDVIERQSDESEEQRHTLTDA